eukprot:3575998-Pyramimonas_sp.AAC.1
MLEIPFKKFCLAPGLCLAILSFAEISHIPQDAKASVVLEATVDEAKLEKFARDSRARRGQMQTYMSAASNGNETAFGFEVAILNNVDQMFQALSANRMKAAIEDLRESRESLNGVEGMQEQGRP